MSIAFEQLQRSQVGIQTCKTKFFKGEIQNRHDRDCFSETSSGDSQNSLSESCISMKSSTSSCTDIDHEELSLSMNQVHIDLQDHHHLKAAMNNSKWPHGFDSVAVKSETLMGVSNMNRRSSICNVPVQDSRRAPKDFRAVSHISGLSKAFGETDEDRMLLSSTNTPDQGSPLSPEELIKLKSLLAKFNSHGSGSKQNQHQAGGNSSQDSEDSRFPSNVVPPSRWGKPVRKRWNGEDSSDDENSERSPNSSSNRHRRPRRVYACPGAKGDPFRNSECLRSTFPNLAKTRQHLACGTHFAVKSTSSLPDQVKDPQGWDEILKYLYQKKEVPSSDPDFEDILAVIETQGAGEGKPDLLSHIIRMVQRCMDDSLFGQQTLSLFESIRAHSSSPKPQTPYARLDVSPPSLGGDAGYQNGDAMLEDLSEGDWAVIASPSHTQQLSPPTSSFDHFSSPPAIVPDQGPSFSRFVSPQSLMGSTASPSHPPSWNSILSGTSNFGQNFHMTHPSTANGVQQSHMTDLLNSHTYMNHGLVAGGPDHNHQPQLSNDYHQLDIPGPSDTAPAPATDSEPQIIIKIPAFAAQLRYERDDGAASFQSWILSHIRPFDFQTYEVRCTDPANPTKITSFQHLREVYARYRHPPSVSRPPLELEISPRSNSSHSRAPRFSLRQR